MRRAGENVTAQVASQDSGLSERCSSGVPVPEPKTAGMGVPKARPSFTSARSKRRTNAWGLAGRRRYTSRDLG